MLKTNCFTRLISVILVLVLVLALSSCATTLKGTYTNKDGFIEQSFTFMDDNVVKVSAFGLSVEGVYSIKDGQIAITYSLMSLSYDWVKSFEKNGDTIVIDGTEFVKEK